MRYFYPPALFILILIFLIPTGVVAQFGNNTAFAKIDFQHRLHPWDGFGVNYVESCQTLDYANAPQDLGGFAFLDQQKQAEIVELFFGEDGLRPGVVKMFLDPWHQSERGGAFDHEWSTQNMRHFVKNGVETARALGDSVQIITTLYGPPAFMTVDNNPSISKLDPEYKRDMALYMINWLKYLKANAYPVTYLSLHNEGTDWLRWPHYVDHPNAIMKARDYNILWRPEDIAEYMAYLDPIMQQEGVGDVGLTPGEPINLFRVEHFGIADAILENPGALKSIDLMTSHGFGLGNPFGRGYANVNNYGAELLQQHKPNLKTWITSMAWGEMDARFGAELYEHIYGNRVSSITPWAAAQHPSSWHSKNKHASAAVEVKSDGAYEILKGYYLYKQFSRAGRPGMQVVRTTVNRPEVFIAAFAANQPQQNDAFVVINLGETLKYVSDMIELNFNVGGNPLYYCFPVKDLALAHEQDTEAQMKNVDFAAQATENGYRMEFAFPWKTLGADDLPESFTFDAQARDGRDMPHGKIGWLGEETAYSGRINLTNSGEENDVVTPQRLGTEIVVDGKADAAWDDAESFELANDRMPGTPPKISGAWQMLYDEDRVYVLITMQDPSNALGRKLAIDIRGSEFKTFKAYRTDKLDENYAEVGEFTVNNGVLEYESPNQSVTTFIGVK